MKIDFKKPRHWILLFQQGAYTIVAIAVRLFRKRPKKPIAILYGHQLSGNLKALYTEWSKSQKTEIDLYFLSLDPDYGAELKLAGISVLQCNRLRDMLHLSRASAFISDHGLHLMAPLVRFTDIVFIDVWHGIPFKGFVPDDFKLQRRYDEVWVSSPLLKTIYETRFGFRPGRVHSLGYARTDKLFNFDKYESTFKEAVSIPPNQKVVLYAPTWQQDDSGRELFPFGECEESFIRFLGNICSTHSATLVIRSHLNTNVGNMVYEGVRYSSQKDFPDTEDLLLATDILICDWSSIAFDYLALNRPTLFLDVTPPFKNGFTLGKEYRFGKIISNMSSLKDFLVKYLTHPESYIKEQADKHIQVQKNVYGQNIDTRSSIRQIERLSRLL